MKQTHDQIIQEVLLNKILKTLHRVTNVQFGDAPAVRFDYRGHRYRVYPLNHGGVLVEEVLGGVLESNERTHKIESQLEAK